MGLYQQRHREFKLQGTEKTRCNERRFSGFLDSMGWEHTAIQLEAGFIL